MVQNRQVAVTFYKSVAGDRDYRFDFADYDEIEVGGLTIASAAVDYLDSVGHTKLTGTLVVGTPSVAGTVVTVRLSVGTLDELYDLTCYATLSSGRVIDQAGALYIDRP
jgi:hypothetical protein